MCSSRLNHFYLVDFELSQLQYSWGKFSRLSLLIGTLLENMVQKQSVGLLFGLILGIVLGLFEGLLFTPEHFGKSLFDGLIVGIIMGISFGPFFSFFQGLPLEIINKTLKKKRLPEIETMDNINWKWSALALTIGKKSINIFISLGLLSLSIFSLYIYSQKLTFQQSLMLLTNQTWSLLTEKKAILITILLISTVGGVSEGLSDFINSNYSFFIQINYPYQRFMSSMRVLHFSILQHWHLRHLLHKKGLLPKKLVPFLNDMVACNILETTGASWRFRHRILQDYFADQWVETEFEPERK